jgi:hypothetical protein
VTDATGNAVSTDALRRIRRLCRDPQDEDPCLVSDAADRSTGPGIERVVKDSRLVTRRARWIVWLRFFRHALLSEDDRAPGCRSEGSDRSCGGQPESATTHECRRPPGDTGALLKDSTKPLLARRAPGAGPAPFPPKGRRKMNPSMTQGIDFFLLRKRLHKEFGSWSVRAAHSRGARDGAAGPYVRPEAVYCARGEMENRIKECQMDLFADRTSTATMKANQLRLYCASMAYVLIEGLRRIALQATDLADASCGTIRRKLFKIGALVTISVRRIKFAMASGLVVKERSYRLGLRQRRPAQGRCRIGVTADTRRPAPNFSATRATPNLNLAEGAKPLSLGEKTCAIAGNGVDFRIMAGRLLRRNITGRLLRRNITESDVGVSYAPHQGAAARRVGCRSPKYAR